MDAAQTFRHEGRVVTSLVSAPIISPPCVSLVGPSKRWLPLPAEAEGVAAEDAGGPAGGRTRAPGLLHRPEAGRLQQHAGAVSRSRGPRSGPAAAVAPGAAGRKLLRASLLHPVVRFPGTPVPRCVGAKP